jgi:hypothetical protein
MCLTEARAITVITGGISKEVAELLDDNAVILSVKQLHSGNGTNVKT